MGQLLIRNVDDRDLDRLRSRAKLQRTSVEALARLAIKQAAQLTVNEKLALAEDMQAWSREARIPGSKQSLGVNLIREARDHDR
jgi:plasmid stability protein